MHLRPALRWARALLALIIASGAAAEPAHGAPPTVEERLADVVDDLVALEDDVDDLAEPVAALSLFDECMFTIGVSEHGRRGGPVGYQFGTGRFPALSLELSGLTPTYEFLAFPQEEPPSIECNEDAGPESVDG